MEKKTGVNLNRIKGLRVEFGYTQTSIANELGIATRTYFCKENGLNQFTIEELVKLCSLFNVKLKDLFF